MTDFKALLENSALSFSDDGIPLQNTRVLKEALDLTKANNTFVTVRGEDPESNGTFRFNEHIVRDKFRSCGATGVAEYSTIACGAMIAYDRGVHLYIRHLSKAESVEVAELAQQLGADAIAEAAPQHLSKTEDLLLAKGSAAKISPPLRIEKGRLAAIESSKSGVASVITTDHAPHYADEKNVNDITKAPSGMARLEAPLSLGLTNLIVTGGLTLSELLARMTINPSSMCDFDTGYLAENGPADIVIFADKEEHIVSDHFVPEVSNPPFIGGKLQGVIKCTVCDDKIVYQAS